MPLHIYPSKKQTSAAAAEKGAAVLRSILNERDEAGLVVATGASQFDLFDALVSEPDVEWHRVVGFHLDEYVGVPITHPASFRNYLWSRFVKRLPTPMKGFHFIHGDDDPEAEINRLNALIDQYTIHLGFIGIGENGHIAFNDPPADFETTAPYHQVTLDAACRKQQMNEGWFPSLNEVPQQAISMSIHHITNIQTLICTVPETRKARAVRYALEGPVTADVPASILQMHPNCHFFLDDESASLLSPRENLG